MLKRIKLYHVLFAVALLTLLTLSAWWFVLQYEQVERVHGLRVKVLEARAGQLSALLGISETPPALPDDSPFELLLATPGEPDSLAPNWPRLKLALKEKVLEEITEKHRSQLLMVSGEGSLLMLLIGVCVLMLYRLLLAERRSRDEMEMFFQAVSHELKTPVAGLKALLETLSARQLQPEEMERYTRLGLKETTRLQSLIDNVLLKNRLDRRIFLANPKPVLVVDALERHIARRNRIFTGQQTELEITCCEDTQALVDPDLLHHVLENLLDNAFKYGGPDVRVIARLRSEGDWCIIEVEDDGRGFDPSKKDDLFEKFVRVHVDNESPKGSGLGLYIARELVNAFGGRLQAESDGPGMGARFTVWLKRVEQ